MKIPLVLYPNPLLLEASKKVDDVKGAAQLCENLIDTMEAAKGIGISAVQIGEPVRAGIIHKDADASLDEHLVIINPKIFSASKDMEDGEEGCLSIPRVFGQVLRHKKIKVRYTDLEGVEHKIKATGLFARVLQHEIDHMDGILFLDRATKITKGEKELAKNAVLSNTNIVFFGTPEFAVPALQALIGADFCDVAAVVTQPDKPVGRHHSKPVPSPIKRIASENGIKVYDGPIKKYKPNADLGVLVAYGEIIPQELIDSFPLGILNIHPSLLPKYRGSSPIQAAILNQDKQTGVTLMQLDNKMDHGPIIAQERESLAAKETAGELHDRLAQIGADLLVNTLPDYIAGRIKPKPQDESKATYTKKLSKTDGRIGWSTSPKAISAHVRAMNPWPGAWTSFRGKKLIIWRMAQDGTPEEVQLEGKNKIPFKEFLKGYPDFEIPKQ